MLCMSRLNEDIMQTLQYNSTDIMSLTNFRWKITVKIEQKVCK